jgi:hypothetical protein
MTTRCKGNAIGILHPMKTVQSLCPCTIADAGFTGRHSLSTLDPAIGRGRRRSRGLRASFVRFGDSSPRTAYRQLNNIPSNVRGAKAAERDPRRSCPTVDSDNSYENSESAPIPQRRLLTACVINKTPANKTPPNFPSKPHSSHITTPKKSMHPYIKIKTKTRSFSSLQGDVTNPRTRVLQLPKPKPEPRPGTKKPRHKYQHRQYNNTSRQEVRREGRGGGGGRGRGRGR